MAITLHFVAIVSVVIWTIACLAARGGRPNRSFRMVLLAFLPFWLIGITSSLLLSAHGVPTVEWIVPGIAVLLIGLACKSDALFTFSRWGLLVVSVLLCANFLGLAGQDYTARPATIRSAWSTLERHAVSNAEEQLREQHPPEAVLPEGPVGNLTTTNIVQEWHTPLTRLYRIHREPAVVWYAGGKVGEAATKLQIRSPGEL